MISMVALLLLMRPQKAIRGAEERESRLLDCCQSVGMVWAAKTPRFVFFGGVRGACRLARSEIASMAGSAMRTRVLVDEWAQVCSAGIRQSVGG